jgi:hypothetical protein
MKKEKINKTIPEIRKTFKTGKLKPEEIEEIIIRGLEENL